MEEIVEAAIDHRGTRCTVGLNTPAIITGGLPLIILLDEELEAANGKGPDFIEGKDSSKTPKDTSKRVPGEKAKVTSHQNPRKSGQSGESEAPSGTRPKIVGDKVYAGPASNEDLISGAVLDGSSPATGMVENLLGTLNSNYNKYPQNFVIRALGYIKIENVVYNIMKYVDGHIMGTFAVDELKEEVHLKDNTGLALLTTIGGLKHPRGRMNIASPSNQQIAVIDKTEIRFNSDNTTFTLTPNGSPDEENNNIIHRGTVLARISEHEDSIKLETHRKLSNVQFAVALLHALQVLYEHEIDKRRIPYEVLDQMPTDSNEQHLMYLQGGFRMVMGLGGLTLRLSCRIDSVNWFADFLSISRHYGKIKTVLTKTDDRYEFSEVSGNPHFFAKRDKEVISVFFSHPIKLIGTINITSGECYDDFDALQVVFVAKPKLANPKAENRLNKTEYMIYARDRMTQMGTIKPWFHAMSIYFNFGERRICKVFIMVFSAVIADIEYGIGDQVVPKVNRYPFDTRQNIETM